MRNVTHTTHKGTLTLLYKYDVPNWLGNLGTNQAPAETFSRQGNLVFNLWFFLFSNRTEEVL